MPWEIQYFEVEQYFVGRTIGVDQLEFKCENTVF